MITVKYAHMHVLYTETLLEAELPPVTAQGSLLYTIVYPKPWICLCVRSSRASHLHMYTHIDNDVEVVQ